MTTECETLLSDSSGSKLRICYKKAIKRCCVIAYLSKDDDLVAYHVSQKEVENYGCAPQLPKNTDYHRAFILEGVKCYLVFKMMPKHALELLWYKVDSESFMKALDIEYYHQLKDEKGHSGEDTALFKCGQYDAIHHSVPKDDQCCNTCSLYQVCMDNGYLDPRYMM